MQSLNGVKSKSKVARARFNLHTLKRLQEATQADPKVDLTSKLPMDYRCPLSEMRKYYQRRVSCEIS
jgi:hypothetical protein